MSNATKTATGATMHVWGDRVEYVTVDTDQWLAERVERDDDLTDAYNALVESMTDRWAPFPSEAIEAFAEQRGWKGLEGGPIQWVNTCNHESALDGVLQYAVLVDPFECEVYVILERHLGGDVRGNYADVEIMRLIGYDGEYVMYDDDRFTVVLACTDDGTDPAQGVLEGMPEKAIRKGDAIFWDVAAARIEHRDGNAITGSRLALLTITPADFRDLPLLDADGNADGVEDPDSLDMWGEWTGDGGHDVLTVRDRWGRTYELCAYPPIAS